MEKTKLDLEIEKYYQKVSGLNIQKIAQTKLKILEKLQKLTYIGQAGEAVERDISNNSVAQARIKLRYNLMNNSKRISGLFQIRGVDYDIGWRSINQIFLNPNEKLGKKEECLDFMQQLGLNFMDTLTLNGLKAYGNYLTLIYSKCMFEHNKIISSAYQSAHEVLDNFDGKLQANSALPNNWQTTYKYIRQLEILTEKEKQFQREVNINTRK